MQSTNEIVEAWLFVHRNLDERSEQTRSNVCARKLKGDRIANEEMLFTEIAQVLEFPYFGRNWNALADCLQDLSWLPADSYEVIWENPSNLLLHQPYSMFLFLDVFKTASRYWRQRGVVMQSHLVDDGLFPAVRNLCEARLRE